jgi:hypothetical protein
MQTKKQTHKHTRTNQRRRNHTETRESQARLLLSPPWQAGKLSKKSSPLAYSW